MYEDKFVISYLEWLGDRNQPYKTLWHGDTYQEALQSFWNSFDEEDKKKLSDVHIYELVLIS